MAPILGQQILNRPAAAVELESIARRQRLRQLQLALSSLPSCSPVDGQANEVKGDGDTAEWLSPRVGHRCRHVARQVSTKTRFTYR